LVLFERQGEFIQFLEACRLGGAPGLVEKCRDMGASWVAVAYSVWLWRFINGAAIGWGSRKEELVDRIGDPKSIFDKIRTTIKGLPRDFYPPGFNVARHMSFMKVTNGLGGASITGEAGDNIGRGGRTTLYFKDESAHYERPELIEAALGDNTDVQVDISSVNGVGNVFYRKRQAGKEWLPGEPVSRRQAAVFIMDWRDHPGKDQQWYDDRKAKAEGEGLLHLFAQEVDRDYAASVEGIIIKPEWIKAAIDAHITLKIEITGQRVGALDVADEGLDTNALSIRKGILLEECEEWSAVDIGETSRKAIDKARKRGLISLEYDSIGIGAGVKAEANRLKGMGIMPPNLRLSPWNAAFSPLRGDEHLIKGDKESPLIKDYYANIKAQGWWELGRRFYKTWRRINDPTFMCSNDELISLSSTIPKIRTIEKELSQPTASLNQAMKLIVDKKPEGSASPNNADSIMMNYCPIPPTRKTRKRKVSR
jgi:hypothetical protein